MSKETIAILINPQGRKKIIDWVVSQMFFQLNRWEILFTAFIKEWPVEINLYKEVWLIGGDGTVNYFLNFYKDIEIPIVIFKGGTGNDFATKLYGNISVSHQ